MSEQSPGVGFPAPNTRPEGCSGAMLQQCLHQEPPWVAVATCSNSRFSQLCKVSRRSLASAATYTKPAQPQAGPGGAEEHRMPGEETQSGCLSCSSSAAFCQLGTSPGELYLPSREESPQAMAREQLPQEAADPPSPAPAAKHQEKKANSSGAECFLSITRPTGLQLFCIKPSVWRQK